MAEELRSCNGDIGAMLWKRSSFSKNLTLNKRIGLSYF